MNKKTIKEVCLKLNIGIASIHDIFIFYELFINSKNNPFSNEVIVAASIFASCKISENPKRIRDIINVLYLVKNKNKILSEDIEDKEFIELLKKDDFSRKETIIKTMFGISLSNYRIMKEEILLAEQHLLRLLSFSFKNMSKSVLIKLVNYSEQIKLNQNQLQLAWDILLYLYEDLSAYEINSYDTLIICSIINIVIKVNESLLRDSENKDSRDIINEQKALFHQLKSGFRFDEEKYISYVMIILNNYYKSNDYNNDQITKSKAINK